MALVLRAETREAERMLATHPARLNAAAGSALRRMLGSGSRRGEIHRTIVKEGAKRFRDPRRAEVFLSAAMAEAGSRTTQRREGTRTRATLRQGLGRLAPHFGIDVPFSSSAIVPVGETSPTDPRFRAAVRGVASGQLRKGIRFAPIGGRIFLIRERRNQDDEILGVVTSDIRPTKRLELGALTREADKDLFEHIVRGYDSRVGRDDARAKDPTIPGIPKQTAGRVTEAQRSAAAARAGVTPTSRVPVNTLYLNRFLLPVIDDLQGGLFRRGSGRARGVVPILRRNAPPGSAPIGFRIRFSLEFLAQDQRLAIVRRRAQVLVPLAFAIDDLRGFGQRFFGRGQ